MSSTRRIIPLLMVPLTLLAMFGTLSTGVALETRTDISETSIVCGYITDSDTGVGIPDSNIYIYTDKWTYTSTNEFGYYELNVKLGIFHLHTNVEGYVNFADEFDVSENETLWVNISIDEIEASETEYSLSVMVYSSVTDASCNISWRINNTMLLSLSSYVSQQVWLSPNVVTVADGSYNLSCSFINDTFVMNTTSWAFYTSSATLFDVFMNTSTPVLFNTSNSLNFTVTAAYWNATPIFNITPIYLIYPLNISNISIMQPINMTNITYITNITVLMPVNVTNLTIAPAINVIPLYFSIPITNITNLTFTEVIECTPLEVETTSMYFSSSVSEDTEITVYADIEGAVSSVSLYYRMCRRTGDVERTIPMTCRGGGRYEATLGPFEPGEVKYTICAQGLGANKELSRTSTVIVPIKDVTPPEIIDFTRITMVDKGAVMTIYVNVTDNYEYPEDLNVTLYLNDEPISMHCISGTTFAATVSAPPGDTGEYYILVADGNDNSGSTPIIMFAVKGIGTQASDLWAQVDLPFALFLAIVSAVIIANLVLLVSSVRKSLRR